MIFNGVLVFGQQGFCLVFSHKDKTGGEISKLLRVDFFSFDETDQFIKHKVRQCISSVLLRYFTYFIFSSELTCA